MNNIGNDIASAYNSGYAEGKRDAIRHGEWEVLWKEKKPYAFQCSECGVISDKLTHFCPNCGAKMDGKESHE